MRPLQSAKWYRRLQIKLHRKAVRKRFVRIGFLASNVVILAIIIVVVLQNSHATSVGNLQAVAATSKTNTVVNPLDQLSSADIALTVARLSNMTETTAINNTADSQAAELAMASTDDSVISKPQVVATALKSRADIQDYTTKAGDTVTSIAAQFGVTSNSIKWSNSLNSDTVAPNQKLTIPPVNGIVYTVKAGDTPSSLAQKFSANEAQIVAYNDAEISGFYNGEQVIIPNGSQPVTSVATASYSALSGDNFAWGGSSPIYGSNGYDYGYCTWYVASQISVPNNWGNASSWAYYAALSGWTVSSTPQVGAIAQTPYAAGGEGHVAIVQAVSPDGSQIKFSDMNGLAGWGRVGYSGWVSAATFPHYIYH